MDETDIRDNAQLAEEGAAGATPDLTEREADTVGQEPQDIQAGTGALVGAEAPKKAEDPYEGAVPPGYDWPTHGGYLGCLMGLVTLSLIGAFIAAPLLALLTYNEVVPLPVAWLLTALVFLACIIGGGRLGWALGKRFYREYPQERPTWGESDDAEVEGVEVEDKTSETNVRT